MTKPRRMADFERQAAGIAYRQVATVVSEALFDFVHTPDGKFHEYVDESRTYLIACDCDDQCYPNPGH